MQTIKLDIAQKNNVPLLYVKQRDVGHKFAIELYENGKIYTVDENYTCAVWYSGESGEGNYTHIGEKVACEIEGNKITVEMIVQMLNEPGGHEMCVVMYGQDNEQKGFWNIPYYVEAIPGADSEAAEAYYQAFLDAQKKAEEAAERAEEAADRAESAGGGSGGGTIIVGIDEGNAATHTASEIYNAIQNKKTVVFRYTGRLVNEFVPLKISKTDLAVFSKAGYPTEFDIFDIEIDNSGTISYNTHFSSDLVNQAVEKVETDLAPVSYLPQTLTEEQQAQARENIGVAFHCENYGLPILEFNGDISAMTKDNAVPLTYQYGERSGSCTLKWQGSSSLNYPKKNYTVKFDEAFEAKDGWGAEKKYCLKANYIDFSHARNLVSAKLWGQIAKTCVHKTKNLIPFPYAKYYDTINGITFTDNEDGSIHIQGTCTGAIYKGLANNVDFGEESLNPQYPTMITNGKYAISGYSSGKYCLTYDAKNKNIMLYIPSGAVVDETVYPQIEAGTTPTAWESNASSKITEKVNSLVNGGAVDGFPIGVVINGEYTGIYTFNIPKDGWMLGMGDGAQEGILCAENSSAGNSFKAEAEIGDGKDFSIEYVTDEDDVAWMTTSLNRLINACINSDGTDIDTTIAQYMDINTAIDYMCFAAVISGLDIVGKNYILATYDGVKWFFSAYDMDSTYGLMWDGKSFVQAKNWSATLSAQAYINRLFELIYKYKKDALKARYNELRNGILSEDNVITTFANFIGQIPKAMLDEEVKLWAGIPNTSTNNLAQIADYYKRRCAVIDAEIEAM